MTLTRLTYAEKTIMTIKRNLMSLLALSAMTLGAFAPMDANAQTNRQKSKNEWRNLAIGAGAVGVYGLLKGDKTLALVGAAGALYSADRYEKDRKSQSAHDRQRAAMFKKGYYYSKGHKYVKKTVTKNGHKYYQFVRSK